MSTSIIICSRRASRRVPEKPFKKINGVPLIAHLLERTKEFNTFLAVPTADFDHYSHELGINVQTLQAGTESDPLARMYCVAKNHGIKTIIRITHDKIFIEPQLIYSALDTFHSKNLDYLYSSEFTAGTGFEIISFEALERAAKQFTNVEHISYAVKAVTKNSHNFRVPKKYQSDVRLLIDYPKDIELLELIFSCLGNDCSLEDVLNFINQNPWTKEINSLPLVSIYTCIYNGAQYIDQCMKSVINQDIFNKAQYIIIDDFSDDKTHYLASRIAVNYPNIDVVKNESNIGLSSSSNKALRLAKGKYIVRLDADDYFVSQKAISSMIKEIEESERDVIYPNNYLGSFTKIQNGKECHHVGGSLFNSRALNHIKFTDKLRNYEGLDLFERAKLQLNIGYLNRPIFMYRQRDTSMSNTNLVKRNEIRKKIENGITGQALL